MSAPLSQEQFQVLLGKISAIHSSTNLNFTQCNHYFSGERDHNKVEQFLNDVTAFKEREKIPDEDALLTLSLLLRDGARTWWVSICPEVNSWYEALERLQSKYAPRPPPHVVYQQIFANPQGAQQTLDSFLSSKKRQLSYLPQNRHSEEVQLDLIYGLLKPDVKKLIPRPSVKTFDELAKIGRCIKSTDKNENGVKPTIKKKGRCMFCRMKGHTADLCRKRAKRLTELENGTLKTSSDGRCLFCRMKGHTVDLCRMIDIKQDDLENDGIKTGGINSMANPTKSAQHISIPESPMSPPPNDGFKMVGVNLMADPTDSTQHATIPESPMSPTPTINSTTNSPLSPSHNISTADSPKSPINDNLTVNSPMSPTSDEDQPRIYCFGCGAPNVWRSICKTCKNSPKLTSNNVHYSFN